MFIGVLSTVPDALNSTDVNDHKIIRFIHSSDIRDAQKLLGVYDVDTKTNYNCTDIKLKFVSYLNRYPLPLLLNQTSLL